VEAVRQRDIGGRITPGTPADLYEMVLRKHPRRANPGSLWGAAKVAKGG
jgi:hypothetical protein